MKRIELTDNKDAFCLALAAVWLANLLWRRHGKETSRHMMEQMFLQFRWEPYPW